MEEAKPPRSVKSGFSWDALPADVEGLTLRHVETSTLLSCLMCTARRVRLAALIHVEQLILESPEMVLQASNAAWSKTGEGVIILQ